MLRNIISWTVNNLYHAYYTLRLKLNVLRKEVVSWWQRLQLGFELSFQQNWAVYLSNNLQFNLFV